MRGHVTCSDHKLHFIKLSSPKYIRGGKVQMFIFCIFSDNSIILNLNKYGLNIKM